MRRYRYKKRDGSWSNDVGLKKLMSVAAIHVILGAGPFTLTQDGERLRGNLTRADVLQKLRAAISHREIGPTFRVRKGNGKVVFIARAVIAVSDVNSTSGNSRCDVLYNWVKANFSEYSPRYAGAYVCKSISGTSQASQHSFGNAIDIFFDSIEHQDRVARAVVQNAGALRPYHVISGQSIWTKGVGWTGYRGIYHAHLHVDFDPQFSGECGVRG